MFPEPACPAGLDACKGVLQVLEPAHQDLHAGYFACIGSLQATRPAFLEG